MVEWNKERWAKLRKRDERIGKLRKRDRRIGKLRKMDKWIRGVDKKRLKSSMKRKREKKMS